MVDFLRALSIVLLLGMFYLAFKNKKFKRFLLIESVLIIVFIIGRQMYTSNLNTMDTVMWSLASDVTNKMITQSDKNIENNMHDVLSTIYDGNGFDIKQNIAFEYKVKDKYKLNNKNFIIFFKDSTNDKYTLFNLEKSFNKKEINNLLDFYNQNQDGCTIKKMSFHSKDNQYIIDQIVFYDENSHMTYKLGNSQGTMNYYSWYKYQNKKANDQNRLGDFELMFFNSKQTLEKNPKEKDIKVEQETCAISSDKSKIYVHYVNKENSILYNIEEIQKFLKNNYQYTYRPGLTGQDKDPVNEFLTDSLKDRFILMFSLVQIILSCIYFIYTYLENEREELNKTRNLFINAMAHEMKTPNAVILNSTEMLIENVNPEKQHKYLRMIEDESKHMNNLLNQMLIYTRTTKSYQLHKQNYNLSLMIEEVLKHYDLESKIITIDIDPKINISCDQQLMMIVFDNLINNAFKYANKKINIVYRQEKIIISNDGSKIENKDINHIFEPLYKADVSRNDTNSTGMGLAIVRNILDLHNYTCKVVQDEEVHFIIEMNK